METIWLLLETFHISFSSFIEINSEHTQVICLSYNDLTYTYDKMIAIISVVNMHHLTQIY